MDYVRIVMAPPSGSHGVERAVGELLAPSVGVIVAVAFTKEFLGPVMAGILYLVLTGGILLGIYTAAINWNIPYTAGFVVSGFVLFSIAPSVISELVHPVFGVLGQILVLVFLVGMALLFVEKSGLDDLLS